MGVTSQFKPKQPIFLEGVSFSNALPYKIPILFFLFFSFLISLNFILFLMVNIIVILT